MTNIISLGYDGIGFSYLKLLYKKINDIYINHHALNITNSNKKAKIKHYKKIYNVCDYSFKYSYSNGHRIKTINVILPVKINNVSFKILHSSRHQIRPQTKHEVIHEVIHDVTHNTKQPIKPVFDIPAPLLRLTQRPVFKDAPDNQKEITASWTSICCILPDALRNFVKPITRNKSIITITNNLKKSNITCKLKKAKNSIKKLNFINLTKEDIKDVKELLGDSVFKKLTVMQLAYLKTHAVKKGIDDWISLIDANLSYDENKLNFEKLFGAVNNDNELMVKYERYDAMLNDSIYGMMPDTGELRL